MILNFAALEPSDLLTPGMPRKMAAGAGLCNDRTYAILAVNPNQLLEKLSIPFSEIPVPPLF